MEMGGGDGSETESVTKEKGKKKSTTGIGASLTPDYRDKEVSVPVSPRTKGIKRYRCQPPPDYSDKEVSVPASPRTTGI